jgi:hypothetical protein
MEAVVKVVRYEFVRRQLHSEAVAVVESENPGAVVGESVVQNQMALVLRGFAPAPQLRVLTVEQVLRGGKLTPGQRTEGRFERLNGVSG